VGDWGIGGGFCGLFGLLLFYCQAKKQVKPMTADERSRKLRQLADLVVKILSGLLGIVFVVFMIMFWLK
jgi:uncharacterized membrane protein